MRTEAAKRKCSFCWRTVFAAKGPFGATVINLAARLCDEARDGQILTNQKTLGECEQLVDVQGVGELHLKGFARPVPIFNVTALK